MVSNKNKSVINRLMAISGFLLVHVAVVSLLILAVKISEVVFNFLNHGENPLLFAYLPVRYIFDFVDLAILTIFGISVVREAGSIFGSNDHA